MRILILVSLISLLGFLIFVACITEKGRYSDPLIRIADSLEKIEKRLDEL